MQIIRQITDHEMVAEFLKAEVSSDRFSPQILKYLLSNNLDKDILLNPNLENEIENSHRLKLLKEYRGYQNNQHIFEGFPHDTKWYLATITKEELLKVQYINWDYWLEISDNTRLPSVVSQNINSEKLPKDKEIDRFIKVSEIIKSGKILPKLILISTDFNSKLVVLEGHVRLTAMALVSDFLPENIKVIINKLISILFTFFIRFMKSNFFKI